MTEVQQNVYCSEMSQRLGEPLWGTAVSVVNTWFLLEYNRPWQAKATDDNDLPKPVKAWFRTQLGQVTNGRVQFIRQLKKTDHLTFFMAIPDDVTPRLYRFELDRYEDLFLLDPTVIAAGDPAYDPFLWTQPLYLVCTNGKRDRCCSKWGAEFFRTLQSLAGQAAWQTTHLGGHRFAPTVLTLPDGTVYGRLTPADAAPFLSEHQHGRLVMNHYRGRSHYRPVEQAADYFLRRESGQPEVAYFQHHHTENHTGQQWRVQFSASPQDTLHEIALTMAPNMLPDLLASCGKPQDDPIPHYTFHSYRVLPER